MMKEAILQSMRDLSMAPRVVATGDGGARSTPKAFEAWHSRGPTYTEMTETSPRLIHTPVAGTTNWYPPAMIGCAGQQNLAPDTTVEQAPCQPPSPLMTIRYSYGITTPRAAAVREGLELC